MRDEDYIKDNIRGKVKCPSRWRQFLQQLKSLFPMLLKIRKSKKNDG